MVCVEVDGVEIVFVVFCFVLYVYGEFVYFGGVLYVDGFWCVEEWVGCGGWSSG